MSDDNDRTGMLDVGTHCSFCRELDFLIFHCSHCDGEFCSKHRSQESHLCVKLKEAVTSTNELRDQPKVKDNGGAYFQSLLPEKGHIRVQNDNDKSLTPSKCTQSFKNSTANKSALDKIINFFHKRKTPKKASSNKVILLAQMKKVSKGDSKIPVSNRIYIQCFVIDNGEKSESEPKDIFINKVWSLGRTLDYLALQLNVPNVNNDFKSTDKERLLLYKKINKNIDVKDLDLSLRVTNEIKDLDILYLVRGEDTTI